MENFNLEKRLSGEFFNRDTHAVAKNLLGKLIVRKFDNGDFKIGRIVEVEAYQGFEDKASHASRKRTVRNEVMFGKAGCYYIYFIYGMYYCLNIVTEGQGFPAAVLIRSVEPVFDSEINISKLLISERRKLSAGPCKLCRWLQIDKELSGKSVNDNTLFFIEDSLAPKIKINKTKRVGVDYAGESAQWDWRYYIKGSKFLSVK